MLPHLSERAIILGLMPLRSLQTFILNTKAPAFKFHRLLLESFYKPSRDNLGLLQLQRSATFLSSLDNLTERFPRLKTQARLP